MPQLFPSLVSRLQLLTSCCDILDEFLDVLELLDLFLTLRLALVSRLWLVLLQEALHLLTSCRLESFAHIALFSRV